MALEILENTEDGVIFADDTKCYSGKFVDSCVETVVVVYVLAEDEDIAKAKFQSMLIEYYELVKSSIGYLSIYGELDESEKELFSVEGFAMFDEESIGA